VYLGHFTHSSHLSKVKTITLGPAYFPLQDWIYRYLITLTCQFREGSSDELHFGVRDGEVESADQPSLSLQVPKARILAQCQLKRFNTKKRILDFLICLLPGFLLYISTAPTKPATSIHLAKSLPPPCFA